MAPAIVGGWGTWTDGPGPGAAGSEASIAGRPWKTRRQQPRSFPSQFSKRHGLSVTQPRRGMMRTDVMTTDPGAGPDPAKFNSEPTKTRPVMPWDEILVRGWSST